MFRQKVLREVSSEYMIEVGDNIRNIEKDDAVWSTLLIDTEFAATLKALVHTWEPTMDMSLAPCTCPRYTRASSLRYGHPSLQQSTFMMHSSFAPRPGS